MYKYVVIYYVQVEHGTNHIKLLGEPFAENFCTCLVLTSIWTQISK
jgi:hypothetical protein